MQEATRKISLSILLPKIFVFRENKLFLAMIQKRMTSELARKIRFYILFRREVRQRLKKGVNKKVFEKGNTNYYL